MRRSLPRTRERGGGSRVPQWPRPPALAGRPVVIRTGAGVRVSQDCDSCPRGQAAGTTRQGRPGPRISAGLFPGHAASRPGPRTTPEHPHPETPTPSRAPLTLHVPFRPCPEYRGRGPRRLPWPMHQRAGSQGRRRPSAQARTRAPQVQTLLHRWRFLCLLRRITRPGPSCRLDPGRGPAPGFPWSAPPPCPARRLHPRPALPGGQPSGPAHASGPTPPGPFPAGPAQASASHGRAPAQ